MATIWSQIPHARRLLITLCFHGVGEMPPGRSSKERPYWVAVEELEALLYSLDVLEARHGVDIQISFDDANASDHSIVLPMLKRYSRQAAFFVPTDRIGQVGSLTAPQIKEMAQAGMTLGSHGTDHVPWTELSNTELSRQLRHSKRVLEHLSGEPVRCAAAPRGLWSPRVISAVVDAGYDTLHTCGERPGRHHGVLCHRLVVRHGDDVNAVILKKLRMFRRAVHKAKDLQDRLLLHAA